MATLAPTRSREPELYGVLDDNDLYSLRQRDSQYLSRYPSFHPSPRTADATMSLHPESQGQDYTRSRKTSEVSRGQAPMPATPLIQVNAVSADQTGQSWYDENAEAWKPTKKSNKLSSRRQHPPPPTRAQPPPPPIEIISAADPDMPQPTSILIKEPAGNFARAKPPRRSAMKGQPVAGTTPASQPSPLPASAMLSPDMAAQRRMAVKQGGGHAFPPPAPSAGAASTPYWASPATTVSRFPSAPNSHRGSSTATSSVAFTSTSFYSNPSIPPSAIPDVPDLPSPGSEPVENPLPRQTLFVVNADPETSESELSPVQDLRKELLPPLPLNLSGSRKPKKGSESRAPPVPPLPPQFQAPPPPAHPPPGDRSRGGPTIPTHQPSGEQDRSVYVSPKRHSSDNRPRASHASSKPPPPSSKYSNGQARLSDSDGTSSSSDEHGRREVKRSKPTPSTAVDSEIPAEWIYPLPLTLEELFKGGKYTYRITTRLLSGEPKVQEVEIDVQAGWKSGTRIVFPAAGHERRPGVFQDMIFVVEQVHHERFARLDGGRLVCNQDIDLQDALKEGPRPKHRIVGLDGKVIEFYVPQGIIKPGTETVIKGEGMYKRSKGKVVGRGDLIVKWNICFPEQVSQAQLLRMRDIFP